MCSSTHSAIVCSVQLLLTSEVLDLFDVVRKAAGHEHEEKLDEGRDQGDQRGRQQLRQDAGVERVLDHDHAARLVDHLADGRDGVRADEGL